MPQKPRRISELVQEAGSTVKPSRISRLPTRLEQTGRTSGSRRTSSTDPSIQPVKNLNLLTTTSRPQRSISATPQRTPLRMKTPTRPSQITLTGERSNDKNWIIAEAMKINEYFKEIEPPIGLGKDFFEKGGIKNMSTKQFINFVNHFLKIISGNRFSVDSNYVETMPKILNEIGYPYTIAKSWLKTPSAPHAFHNVVQLFTWFLTFLPSSPLSKPIEQIEEYENFYVSENKDFIDKNYACKFIRQSREIFSAWNKGSDNIVEEAKIKLANDMIKQSCGLNALKDLEFKIESLKIHDNEIQSKLKEDLNFDEFNRLDIDYNSKIKILKRLEKVCESNAEVLKDLEFQIESKENFIKNTEKEIEEIKSKIKKQKLNVKERDNLLIQMNALNHELKVKTDNILQLQEEGSENQIALSRLIHRKTTLITKLNTFIYNLFTEIKLSNLCQINEFSLTKDCKIDDIKRVEIVFKKLSQQLAKDISEIENRVKKLEEYVSLLNMENENILKPKLEKCSKKNEDCNEEIIKIEKQIKIILDKNETHIKKLELQLSDLVSSEHLMITELEIKTDKLKKLEESNLQNWNNFESEMDSILTYREKKLDTINEAIDSFYKPMEDFKKIVSENVADI